MTTRTIITIVVIFFILILGGMGWFYFSQSQTQGGFVSGTNNPLNFFPFGGGGGGAPQTSTPTATTTPTGTQPIVAAKLQQLTTTPIAGAVEVFDNTQSLVRYTERATGHTYDIATDGTMAAKRISNTTVPKVYEAVWSPSASSSVLLRYLDTNGETVLTYSGKLIPNGTESDLTGAFLPKNIDNLALSPDGARVAAVVRTMPGESIVTSNLDGTKKTEVFESPISLWQVSWPATTTIALLSKPSGATPGFLYFLNTSTLKASRLLGDIAGLSASVNPDASKIVFSKSSNGSVALESVDVKTGTISDLPLTTIPADKCAWNRSNPTIMYCGAPLDFPSALYPDAWYQGAISFSDTLWSVDLKTGNATLVDLLKTPTGIDVIHPFLSRDGAAIFFTNKKDGTLWRLFLK